MGRSAWLVSFLLSAGALVPLALPIELPAQTFSEQSLAVLGQPNIDARSASLADIDNDGDLDLLFQAVGTGQRLYLNNFVGSGVLTYTNITGTNLSGIGDSWSAAWGDFNGDGFVDVFVGQTNSGTVGDVLMNTGGAFTNTTTTVGLADPGFHQSVAWADIDNDRDLDLIIAMEGPEKHEIYLQGPGGLFTPVGAAVGLHAPAGTKAYGMAIGDTDGDGDLDIYISTCRGDNNIRNNFFENQLAQTGTLSFLDIADTNGTQFMTNSYGSEFHDFDNDGDLDLFMVGADGQPSKIFRNNGGNSFTDVDLITGHPLLSQTGGDFNGGRAVDYDNDGDLDLFFHDNRTRSGRNFGRKLFRNDGNWTFTDVTTAEGLHTVNQGAYDSTWGDLDRDGDLDLIAPTNGTHHEHVFISAASTNGNHWLYVDLAGPSDNTTGIGASLYATVNLGTPQELTLRREANSSAGAFNQSDLPVHFGLGQATLVDQLRIHWPDGTVQYLFDVAIDQYLTVAYDGGLPGDLNGDGTVDAADHVLWRKGLDVRYTSADFALWQSNFGRTSAGDLAFHENVPEPAAATLALSLAALLALARRHRSSNAIALP